MITEITIIGGCVIAAGAAVGAEKPWQWIRARPYAIRHWYRDRRQPVFDDELVRVPDYPADAVAEPDAPTALISLEIHHPEKTAAQSREDRQEAAWRRFEAATGPMPVFHDDYVRPAARPASVPVVHEDEVIDVRTGVISKTLPHFEQVTADSVEEYIMNLGIRAAEFRAQLVAWASADRLEITAGV
jgi:hypothetical protein